MLHQSPRDLLLPSRGPDQPFMKSIGLTELKAYSTDCLTKIARARILAESMQDPLFVGGQVIRIAGSETPQECRISRLGLSNTALALRRRGGWIESQYLVDQAEIAVVMHQSLLGRDLRVDADPKAYFPLERGGMSKGIRHVARGSVGVQERRDEKHDHLDWERAAGDWQGNEL